MVLLIIDTSPMVPAMARPFNVAPLFMVMDAVSVKIFPMNEAVVPRDAEVLILHHTLHGSPPITDEPDPIIRSDPVLKIQTPEPLRVRVPVSERLLVEQ
jgi:hypothetical protein